MNNKPDLDNELADMVDMMMAGKEAGVSPDNEDYANLVKQLYRVVASDSAPDAAFRARLTQRLNSEWDMAFPRQVKRTAMPRFRMAAGLAASLILVLGIIAVLLGPLKGVTNGTAQGGNPATVIVIVVVGIAIVLVSAVILRRRG